MSASDFGYFLLFIGVAWLAVIMPFDPTPFKGSLILPVGLIIFGLLYLAKGFIDLELLGKLLGYAFLIFIILLVRANGFFFVPWTFFTEPSLTEEYNNSFIIDNGSILSLGCDACSIHLLSSPDSEVKAFMKHTATSNPVVVEGNGSLSVNLDQEPAPISGGEVSYSIPSITSDVSLHSGIGSIEVSLLNPFINANLNVSTGAGSLNLTNFGTVGFKNVNLNTGVGSLDVLIDSVNGNQILELDTGVGSIELLIKPGLIIQFQLSTGLGSVSNQYGSASSTEFDNATNRLIVRAHTGLGSVDVKLID